MICKDVPDLIQPYTDAELDSDKASALEAHLRDCRDCNRLVEAERNWQRTVQAGMTRFTASDRLRARLAVALAEADGTAAARPPARAWRPLARPRASASSRLISPARIAPSAHSVADRVPLRQ